MVRLIDDLIDVSRITRGLITLQRDQVELGAVVARAVETVKPVIDEQRHTLKVSLPDQTVTLLGDETRLAQVIGNLLHNAAKYTEPGGQIALTRVRRQRPRPDQRSAITASASRQPISRSCSSSSLRWARGLVTHAPGSVSALRWCAGSSRCTAAPCTRPATARVRGASSS